MNNEEPKDSNIQTGNCISGHRMGVLFLALAELMRRLNGANTANKTNSANSPSARIDPVPYSFNFGFSWTLSAFIHPEELSLRQYEPDEWSVGCASSVAGGSQYRWARLLLQCPDESNAVGEAHRAHGPRRGSYTLRVNRFFFPCQIANHSSSQL